MFWSIARSKLVLKAATFYRVSAKPIRTYSFYLLATGFATVFLAKHKKQLVLFLHEVTKRYYAKNLFDHMATSIGRQETARMFETVSQFSPQTRSKCFWYAKHSSIKLSYHIEYNMFASANSRYIHNSFISWIVYNCCPVNKSIFSIYCTTKWRHCGERQRESARDGLIKQLQMMHALKVHCRDNWDPKYFFGGHLTIKGSGMDTLYCLEVLQRRRRRFLLDIN